MSFSKDFIWGAATASFQIEGAAYEDGKSLSIWDVFCKTPGKVFDGHTGDTACDHYHRYQEDVDIMADLGLNAYRFSFSWPRIIPNGNGRVNQKGIDFYNKLIDALLEKNIAPFATLFHWDMPYSVYQRGGFLNPESVDWFAAYAGTIGKHFGDRVKNFFTFNEPQCTTSLGYEIGIHAPGLKMPRRDIMQMAHNILLAHGKAVQALRANSQGSIQVGMAPTCAGHYPATNSKEDIDACTQAQLDIVHDYNSTEFNAFCLSYWNDAMYLGDYPKKAYELFAEDMPVVGANDFKIITETVDFHGHNIYNGRIVESDGNGGYRYVKRLPGYARTSLNWPVTPESLLWLPKLITERYKKPIFITENGLSNTDSVSLDGKVHDPQRIDFLHRYLKDLSRACDEGANILGYFQWSLLDNFEWHSGYSERFGLVHVDYQTQKRILKDSAHWYKEVIKTNGKDL